jgi:CHAT domain
VPDKLAVAVLAPLNDPVGEPVRRVVIVPAGRLAYLPFEMLHLPDGVLVADCYIVSYAPSAAVLTELRHRPARTGAPTFVGFGDPILHVPSDRWFSRRRGALDGAAGHR